MLKKMTSIHLVLTLVKRKELKTCFLHYARKVQVFLKALQIHIQNIENSRTE